MAHAEQIFRDLLIQIAAEQKLTNYDLQVTPISTCGANYTSHLFLATLAEGKREIDLFAKVAAIGDKLRANFPMQLYDIERLFYTKIRKVFHQLEEKYNIPEEHRLKVPVFYGYNGELYKETIVLENLSSKGYCSYDRFKTVDWAYAASAITELAKYHALSVAYHNDEPEDFEKDVAQMKLYFAENGKKLEPVWNSITKKAVEATREENKEKLKKFFETNCIGNDNFLEFYVSRKLAVIGHGDYRPSNLMHKVLEDGSVEVIAVDYQTMRGGSPVVDLLYFIFSGTDAEFRAHYYQKLVNHYYSELSAALTRLGLNPDEKYSKEDFELELKEKLPFGLAVSVFLLPLVTVEAENAPKVSEDMDMNDFSITKTGSLFPERMNGVVDDYVRWGVL